MQAAEAKHGFIDDLVDVKPFTDERLGANPPDIEQISKKE